MTDAKFITFEGGEGTGKSTQAKLLAAGLEGCSTSCVLTREPGGTKFAEQVRDLVLSVETGAHDVLAETLLFYGARADHLAKVIRPALQSGSWVISDRFSDSTAVYQGIAGGLKRDVIATLEQIVVEPTRPDLTIILDLRANAGLARAQERRMQNSRSGTDAADGPDNFEGREAGFHEKLREGFLEVARGEPDRCIVIDAERPVEQIAQDVWNAVSSRLLKGGS